MATAPEKRRARKAVKRTLASGKLVKPDSCEVCGTAAEHLQDRKLYAHHSDYSKPLDVDWLCRECHAYRHYFRMDIEPKQFCNVFSGTDAAEVVRLADIIDGIVELDPYSWPPPL